MNAQSFIDAGLHYLPHSFTVPLDYQDLSNGTINGFARSAWERLLDSAGGDEVGSNVGR